MRQRFALDLAWSPIIQPALPFIALAKQTCKFPPFLKRNRNHLHPVTPRDFAPKYWKQIQIVANSAVYSRKYRLCFDSLGISFFP